MQNMKSIGENQMICHKPYQKIEALEFSRNKVKFANINTGNSFIAEFSFFSVFIVESCM